MPGEPRWTRLDRLLVYAWMAEEADKCPGCHLPFSETTDVEAFEDYDTTAIACHACAERERQREHMNQQGAPQGLFLFVHKREDLIFGE